MCLFGSNAAIASFVYKSTQAKHILPTVNLKLKSKDHLFMSLTLEFLTQSLERVSLVSKISFLPSISFILTHGIPHQKYSAFSRAGVHQIFTSQKSSFIVLIEQIIY